jgi:hypothetical protein
LLDFGWSQDVTLHQGLEILNQFSSRLERGWSVSEHNAVPADSGVG